MATFDRFILTMMEPAQTFGMIALGCLFAGALVSDLMERWRQWWP